MSDLTFRREAADPEPVLVVDGRDIQGEATLTIEARGLAALMYAAFVGGIAHVPPPPPPPTIVKEVVRDDAGRITFIVERPAS